MPESKLAEKLGFRVDSGYVEINESDVRDAKPSEVQALWNLCLELSERLAGFESRLADREGLAKVISKAVDRYPVAAMSISTWVADRVIDWLAADPERKDA